MKRNQHRWLIALAMSLASLFIMVGCTPKTDENPNPAPSSGTADKNEQGKSPTSAPPIKEEPSTTK